MAAVALGSTTAFSASLCRTTFVTPCRRRFRRAVCGRAAVVEEAEPLSGETLRGPPLDRQLPFAIGDLRQAIPAHCFERSALKSFGYLLRDVIAIGALVYASTFIDPLPVSAALKYAVLWPLYWFWVGAFGVGLWIVAHECGHGAFSERPWLNDAVGLIAHSVLLVPYFSWCAAEYYKWNSSNAFRKHSHRRHHSSTGHLTDDEVFVPRLSTEVTEGAFAPGGLLDSKLVSLLSVTLVLIFGFPLYLLTNFGGRKYQTYANHFNPFSPIFKPKERLDILISDIGIAAVLAGLFFASQSFGFATVFKTYVIPYFVVHVWLVAITFLHHTHPNCPHYDDSQWDWLKGALSTIDRDFGFLNVIFHRITDTHVLHHIFSHIPHYHAVEASEAIKPILGPYYKSDDRHLVRALWEDFCTTKYAAPDKAGEGVFWYRG